MNANIPAGATLEFFREDACRRECGACIVALDISRVSYGILVVV